MGHSTTRGCSFAGSSTAAVVSDLTGNVTYRAAPSTVFSMPWEGLKGLHTVVLAQTTLKDLCSLEGASWAGSVVLGGDFSGGGCSFERRALAAASRQAAGILFHGWTLGEHQPFDWDGSSQTGLAAGALALNEEYICIQQAVFAAGGQAKIELTPEVTPLSATWYLALGRTLFAVLCVAQTSNVVVGALQQARFHQSGMEIMTRAVVGMEMFSQIMFLVKILNGPGYDIGWQSVIPHYAHRFSLSLAQGAHVFALLLVSKQLRRTEEALGSRNGGSCKRCGSSKLFHAGLAVFFVLVVVVDVFVFASFDAVYQVDNNYQDFIDAVFILNTVFFGAMGVYYFRTARAITRGLLRASVMTGSKDRARQFSRNVQRVGVFLVLDFVCIVITVVMFLAPPDDHMAFYVGTTLSFALAHGFRSLESLFVILSYRSSKRPIHESKQSKPPFDSAYGSSADLCHFGSHTNLPVDANSLRNSDGPQQVASPCADGAATADKI